MRISIENADLFLREEPSLSFMCLTRKIRPPKGCVVVVRCVQDAGDVATFGPEQGLEHQNLNCAGRTSSTGDDPGHARRHHRHGVLMEVPRRDTLANDQVIDADRRLESELRLLPVQEGRRVR